MLPNDLDNRDNSISSEDEDISEEKITKVGISTYREDTCMHVYTNHALSSHGKFNMYYFLILRQLNKVRPTNLHLTMEIPFHHPTMITQICMSVERTLFHLKMTTVTHQHQRRKY